MSDQLYRWVSVTKDTFPEENGEYHWRNKETKLPISPALAYTTARIGERYHAVEMLEPIPSPRENQHEQVLQLLITGGFLNPDKLQEARDIIGSVAPSKDQSLEEAAQDYADKIVPVMGLRHDRIMSTREGAREDVQNAFLAGAAYGKGGEEKRTQQNAHYADNGEIVVCSNVHNKSGIDIQWLRIWEQVEIWYGDIEKKETGEQFLKRLQATYFLSRPSIDIVDELRKANPWNQTKPLQNGAYNECCNKLSELLTQQK